MQTEFTTREESSLTIAPGDITSRSGAVMSAECDLAIAIVSCNDRDWLEPCLASIYARAGNLELRVVVVDNGSDGAHQLVRERFPTVTVIQAANRGFANASNLALARVVTQSRYVLLLNPDTEIVEGTLEGLLAALDARPEVGVAGVVQVSSEGELHPTIRYFPTVSRALGEALGGERWPRRPRWLGERELDPASYARETICDWTSGSFMLARREALLSAGLLDERFFLYSEETDLCKRIREAGWDVRHLPYLKIVHHAGRAGMPPRFVAQQAFARAQYARKHLSGARRPAYLLGLMTNHLLRAGLSPSSPGSTRRSASRLALLTVLGVVEPPFVDPPATAIAPSPSVPPTHGRQRAGRRLLMISPVRNEAAHIERVAWAVAAQTEPPSRWIVIDDGSTDETRVVIERIAQEIPFLTVLEAPGRDASGVKDQLEQAPEVRSFNAALASVDPDEYTHVMKLDGDIELPSGYLQTLLDRLEVDADLGLVGGVLVERDRTGRAQTVQIPRHHVHGAIKLYTRQCFEAIGGIQPRLGWDTIDETYARMRGFKTRSYADLVSTHHRPSASADGILRGRARHGACAYINHYPGLWVLARSVKVGRSSPRVLSGLAFLYGYLRAAARGRDQVPDMAYRAFTRRELRRRAIAGVANSLRLS